MTGDTLPVTITGDTHYRCHTLTVTPITGDTHYW